MEASIDTIKSLQESEEKFDHFSANLHNIIERIQNMSELINNLTENISNTSARTQEMNAAMSTIDDKVDGFVAQQQTLLQSAQVLIDVALSLDKMEKRYFLQARLIDHRNWVKTLEQAIQDRNPKVNIALDHTLCKFGKWYFNYTPPENEKNIYQAFNRPHDLVHASGRKIIDELKNGHQAKALNIFQGETLNLMQEIEHLFETYQSTITAK